MTSTFDITTLVFIALAIFVAWRLRSVLGQRDGAPPPEPLTRRDLGNGADRAGAPVPSVSTDGNVVRLPGAERPVAEAAPPAERWAGLAEPGTPVSQGLDAIATVDPSFDGRQFVDGAKMAYEMVVTSFAEGNRKMLKDLLAREVYDGFDRAITEREKANQKVETTFVSIDDAKVMAAELRGKTAQVTLRFASSLITATRDASGKVIEGDPEAVAHVTDVWTFARNVGARDPNWQLVATESEH